MEAKDTVMTRREIAGTLTSMGSAEGDLTFAQRKLLEKQAEISFKAGIKEAVEWIQSYVQLDILEDENGHPIPYYCFDDIVLQAKLKEWGIK